MSSAKEIITTIVCPLLGLCITTVMWSSPLKVILEIRRSREMGTTNPLPFAVTVLNCTAWVIYSCLIKDVFIFLANISGLCLGLYYTINCMTVLTKNAKPNEALDERYQQLEGLIVFAAFFWSLIGFLSAMIFNKFDDPVAQMAMLVGNIGTAFAIGYYAAPLSVMAKVITLRDSSFLYLPTTLVNIVNAGLWSIYGFAVQDVNVYGPNVVGLVLSICQLILIMLFPRKTATGNIPVADEETRSTGSGKVEYTDIYGSPTKDPTTNPLH